jgi:hypothetical protein
MMIAEERAAPSVHSPVVESLDMAGVSAILALGFEEC